MGQRRCKEGFRGCMWSSQGNMYAKVPAQGVANIKYLNDKNCQCELTIFTGSNAQLTPLRPPSHTIHVLVSTDFCPRMTTCTPAPPHKFSLA
jgi:hypothetical protein